MSMTARRLRLPSALIQTLSQTIVIFLGISSAIITSTSISVSVTASTSRPRYCSSSTCPRDCRGPRHETSYFEIHHRQRPGFITIFFSSTYNVGRWVYAWTRIQRKLTFAWHTRLESLSSYVHTICSMEDVVVKIPHPLGRCWRNTAEIIHSVSFVYLGQRR
ncbi:hypothetical protein M422DRAFT_253504 [Sphaerobolus stellatus SS14]|uniref:Uncharacterized protein n=1 Tax=Sphaerobolus stellatus (strain SS14) TaxID=990650 RepID=A0A0C9VN02_SPHS4|nr:hypothetical protein M422DRAFT_253504 [Sphaerobolus stellatus SS14]